MAISKWPIDKLQSGPVRLFALALGFENKRAKTPAGLLFSIVTVTLRAERPVSRLRSFGQQQVPSVPECLSASI
jgi:hypothetical protein